MIILWEKENKNTRSCIQPHTLHPSFRPLVVSDLPLGRIALFPSQPLKILHTLEKPNTAYQKRYGNPHSNSHLSLISLSHQKSLQRKKIPTYRLLYSKRFFLFLPMNKVTWLLLIPWAAVLTCPWLLAQTDNSSAEQEFPEHREMVLTSRNTANKSYKTQTPQNSLSGLWHLVRVHKFSQ